MDAGSFLGALSFALAYYKVSYKYYQASFDFVARAGTGRVILQRSESSRVVHAYS